MSGHRPMKAAHDVLFDAQARRAFCARLRDLGIGYNELADELERLGMPRPSGGSGAWRALLVTLARQVSGDTVTLAERAARLYDGRSHAGGQPPADDDGYIAAIICDDAATVCAAVAPVDHTICAGRRAWWAVLDCRWPEMGESGVCAEVA